jgi:phosphate acetyltransferase
MSRDAGGSGLLEKIEARAAALGRTIVLPETSDERVVAAAGRVLSRRTARLILLGREEDVRRTALDVGTTIDGASIIDPASDDRIDDYAASYAERRKHRGVGPEDARRIVADPVFYAAMMVADGRADGFVAGSIAETAKVIRAGLHCIGTAPGTSLVTSAVLVVVPRRAGHPERAYLFADAGVVPRPTTQELAEIAVAGARTWRSLVGTEPRVAMLSFSTYGSAEHEDASKMAEAARLACERTPELMVDGELQIDAAIVPDVARRKCPESPLGGRANVLVFPDLGAGNIAYKITERMGDSLAVGPLLQGLAKPANDLSRGCVVEDIQFVIAVTALQGERVRGAAAR